MSQKLGEGRELLKIRGYTEGWTWWRNLAGRM